MQSASEKAIKAIKQKDFQKYLTVANPRNGDEFFNQVYTTFSPQILFGFRVIS
jgi:hypothetical protein